MYYITEFEKKDSFSLTTMDIGKLAYKFVVRNKTKHSFDNVVQTTGKDWWIGFKKRYQNILTIRKLHALPE